MVAWAIWNRRNNLRLGKPAAPLSELIPQAQDRLREFKLYNFSTIIPMGRPPTSWQAPNSNTCKVNFDGALFATENSAGLGVVIRNSEGQVLLSLSEKNHTSLYSYQSGSTGSKKGFESSTKDQVSADNLRRGLADTYLSTSKQYSLSVKLWTHNEGHSVSCLVFFKNKLLSCA